MNRIHEDIRRRIDQWEGYAREDVLFLTGMCASEDEVLGAVERSWMRTKKEIETIVVIWHVKKEPAREFAEELDKRYKAVRETARRLYEGSLDD